MNAPSEQQTLPSGLELVSEVSDLAVGVALLTFTLFPFALPLLILLALAAAVLLIPALGVALLIAPLLVARRYRRSRDRSPVARRSARLGDGEVGDDPAHHELVLRGGTAA